MEDRDKRTFMVPGCNYAGLNNPLPNGIPTCHTDKIAEEHDYGYKYARTPRDIRKADGQAICGFFSDVAANGSCRGAIGAAGILGKYLVERATGQTFYPTRFAPNPFRRTHREGQSCDQIWERLQQWEHQRENQQDQESNLRENVANSERLRQNHNDQYYKQKADRAKIRSEVYKNNTNKKEKLNWGPSFNAVLNSGHGNKQSEKARKYSPYNKPNGYKEKPTWPEGPCFSGAELWFHSNKRRSNKPGHKKMGVESTNVSSLNPKQGNKQPREYDANGELHPSKSEAKKCTPDSTQGEIPIVDAVEDPTTMNDTSQVLVRNYEDLAVLLAELVYREHHNALWKVVYHLYRRIENSKYDVPNTPALLNHIVQTVHSGRWGELVKVAKWLQGDESDSTSDNFEIQSNSRREELCLSSMHSESDWTEYDLDDHGKKKVTRSPEYDLMQYLTRPQNEEGVRCMAKQHGKQWVYMAGGINSGGDDDDIEQDGAYGGVSKSSHSADMQESNLQEQRPSSSKRPREGIEKDKVEIKRQKNSLQKQARLKRLEMEAVNTQLLDIEGFEKKVEKWEDDWHAWGSTKEHIGQRPMQQATSRVMNLKDELITPLLRAYKDLANETVFLRRKTRDFSRITDSVESIERLVIEEQRQRRNSESSVYSEAGTSDLVSMLLELQKSTVANTTRIEAKIMEIGKITQNVISRIDKLEREGLKALSNKVEVVRRRVGGEENQQREQQPFRPPQRRDQQQRVQPQKDQANIMPRKSAHRETESDLNPTTPAATEDENDGWETVEKKRKRKTKLSRKARTQKKEGIISKRVEIAIDRSKKQLSAPRRTIIVKKQKDADSLNMELEAASSGDEVRARNTYAQALCSPKTVRKNIKSSINAREEGLQIDEMRPVGKSVVKLVAATPDQAVKLSNKLVDAGFIVEKERLPDRPLMVKVRRVDRNIKKEELASYIYDQNPWVRTVFPQCTDLEKEFAPAFQMGRRNDANGVPIDDCIWVVRVTEALRKELLKQGKLYINLDICPISDFAEVTRCFKCQGYGHIAAKCQSQEGCGSCAGDHNTRVCPIVNLPSNVAPEPKKCVNCKRINLEYIHAVENPNCPVYRRALKRYIRRVNPLMDVQKASEAAGNRTIQ